MNFNKEIDKGLSDFIQNTTIVRSGEVAEIIVDYYEGKPIRLLDFTSNSSKSDFDISEEGYFYYQELKRSISSNK